jgi:hypothetical protein
MEFFKSKNFEQEILEIFQPIRRRFGIYPDPATTCIVQAPSGSLILFLLDFFQLCKHRIERPVKGLFK